MAKKVSAKVSRKTLNELILEKDIEGYKKWLSLRNLSSNSVNAYLVAITHFFKNFDEMDKTNLMVWKSELEEDPDVADKTVNSRIIAIHSYIEYMVEKYDEPSYYKLKLKCIKITQKNFLENVVSKAEYLQFLTFLKKNWYKDDIAKNKEKDSFTPTLKGSYKKMYYIVRCIGATGVRISELVMFNVQAVQMGYFDVLGKGKKTRRIYIPRKLQNELLTWINEAKLDGFLFKNKNSDNKMTTRAVTHLMKDYAEEAGLNLKVIYPHSFRHMYAKNFLAKRQDIALLADLLGHSNIETTRIYLRLTSQEQKAIVDEVVDW